MRLKSWLNLAWAILRHFARLLVRRPGDGLRTFLHNYRPERLLPIRPEERAWLAAADRCIACGLCNTVCPGFAERRAPDFGGPMALAAAARGFPDLPALRAHLAADLPCGPCHACEEACPTGVPLVRLAEFARVYVERVGGGD